MNNSVPFIPSEPPPIINENFDHEPYDSETYSPYKSRDSINDNVISDEPMDVDVYSSIQSNGDLYQYENYGRDNNLQGSRNPVELYQYIESVVTENNLRPDILDSAAVIENIDELSEKSFDGEFDDYINQTVFNQDLNNENNVSDIDNQEPDKEESFIAVSPKQEVSNDFLNKCDNLSINDSINNLGDISFTEISSKDCFPIDSIKDSSNSEIKPVDYFPSTEHEETLKWDLKLNNFANFTEFGDYSHELIPESNRNYVNQNDNPTIDDFDDDFEDFATFENDPETVTKSDNSQNDENLSEKSEEILNKMLESIMVNFNSVELELNSSENISSPLCFTRPDSFISNQTYFSDVGLFIWKELTNYDYSPAFIFQWMQSATYEKFMTSIGPEYKDMLSSHRAALPLFSVNLTPIEPVPADNCLPANVSASSSNIDLTLKDECGGINLSDRNSTIDFKNLEEEFIFDKFSSPPEVTISDVTLTNSSSSSNLSSTVIQSEGFGGILKSILKPLNPSKASPVNKPINPQVEVVLKELPDLSYMSSKVLMFPVISTCDVEDNI